jgi:hypothetical protein
MVRWAHQRRSDQEAPWPAPSVEGAVRLKVQKKVGD